MRGARFVVFFLLSGSIWGYGSTSGADFLMQDFSARSSGIGGASVSKGFDLTYFTQNPASIAYMRYPEAYFNHNAFLGGFKSETLAFGSPVSTFLKKRNLLPKEIRFLQSMRFATFFSYGFYKDIEVIGNDFDTPERTVSASNFIWGLGGAYNLRSYRIGMTMKIFGQTLADYSDTSFAIDVGGIKSFEVPRFLPYPRRNNLRVGLVIGNLGVGMQYSGSGKYSKYEGANEDLPLVFKPGITYGIYGDRIHIVDISVAYSYYVLDGTLDMHTGIEYRIFGFFYFRIGAWITGYETNLTFGAGGRYLFRKVLYKLDYAVLPRLSGVGDSMQLTFHTTFRFFGAKKRRRITSIGILEGEDSKKKKKQKLLIRGRR